MLMTSLFFVAEITTGYITHSVALVADSFHMLSDVISLIVGFIAVRMSSRSTPMNTYGWQRAEVLGALVNSVFLIALCFTIIVEAVQRFIEIEEITDPDLVLIIGGLGLVVNVIGLFLFSSHGMSHGHSHGGGGGHGHSHGGGGHGHSHNGHGKKKKHDEHKKSPLMTATRSDLEAVIQNSTPEENSLESSVNIQIDTEQFEESGIHLAMEKGVEVVDVEEPHEDKKEEEELSAAAQLNMRGVFLHVLGDALGSVVVIISALIIKYAEGDWRFYIDPALSLAIVFIIISSTIPLFKQSSMILLQSLPGHVNIFDIENRLVGEVKGIENIHEFHVWQLSSDKIVATAHMKFLNIHEYMEAAKEIKSFLHDEGIHSTTIQPEFSEDMLDSPVDTLSDCMLMCQPENCRPKTCCGTKGSKDKKTTNSPTRGEGEDNTSCQIATQTMEDELDIAIGDKGDQKTPDVDDETMI